METICTPSELKQKLPANSKQLEFIQESRRQIAQILDGEDPRMLLIVGPCSIHDLDAAKEYATRLQALSKQIAKQFYVIMRAYFEKPRTIMGWKGMLYDPHLDGTHDIHTGLNLSRQFLLELADLNVAAATEFLDPMAPRYFGDLISWGCIGARTAESQVHRQFASGLPMPIAFKNSTSGNVHVAVNGVLAATHPQSFFSIDDSGRVVIVQTRGNPHAHVTLRGGENKPNYDASSIAKTLDHLQKAHLPQRVIVDCSHDNSQRKHEEQKTVFRSVVEQYVQGNTAIRGMILESHLFAGNQRLPLEKSRLQYAVSLTDPCLDWASTEKLIRWGVAMIERKSVALEASQGPYIKTQLATHE